MKKTILKQLIKVALFSVCATSIAQAQLPVADVAPETVTLQCHNANEKGLASMILNIKETRHAFSTDFNSREVVLGSSMSFHVFDGFVVDPAAVRESLERTQASFFGTISGREGSNRLQNIPKSVSYTDEESNVEITVSPNPDIKDHEKTTLTLNPDEQEVLARIVILKNGKYEPPVLMKCQTWNGK
jgi:hypothetical protein